MGIFAIPNRERRERSRRLERLNSRGIEAIKSFRNFPSKHLVIKKIVYTFAFPIRAICTGSEVEIIVIETTERMIKAYLKKF